MERRFKILGLLNIEPPPFFNSHWRGLSKYNGCKIYWTYLKFSLLLEMGFKILKLQNVEPLLLFFIPIWEGVQKYYGCIILNSSDSLLLLEMGFKIVWLRHIEPHPHPHPPYFSNFMGEGFQNNMAAKCWTLHIFIISIREGVQNVAQNIEPTFYLNPSPIEIENGRRFNILRLIIILTPSTLRIGYWRPEFNRSQR